VDEEGHRTYYVTYLVRTDDSADGPEVVSGAAGLPAVGSAYSVGNDSNPWAFCRRNEEITIAEDQDHEPAVMWQVEKVFSTLPMTRCQDTSIEDPLLEPDRISGGSVTYTEEAVKDRNGDLILTSSLERIRGPQVEFDAGRHTVHVEQNVADLELDLLAEMLHKLNDATLWGLDARKIKFSKYGWRRLIYGVCDFYYVRLLDFDIRFDGFDRIVPDEGTKVLAGEWVDDDTGTGSDEVDWVYVAEDWADKDNPQHFYRFKDPHGDPCRVLLDGAGLPANVRTSETGTGVGTAGEIEIEKYDEDDLLLLGIPTTL
jgi:hypothetical protein